jgi:plastocyanin
MKKITILALLNILFLNLFAQTSHNINMGMHYFNPSVLTISSGDTVKWISDDGGYHGLNFAQSLTPPYQSFNNPGGYNDILSPTNVNAGSVFYIDRFTVPGTYNYECQVTGHASNGMTGQIIVNNTLSTFENETNFKIFPNPANENITISVNNYSGNIQTEVFDLIGNKLQITNETTISLVDYPKGMYLLKIAYGDRVEEVKVIKD